MSTVETVGGAVPVESLGVTLMHEHVVLLEPESVLNKVSRWRDEVEIPAAQADLAATKAAGVGTIVDLTAVGLGRDVERVRAIAGPSGINVIVATGIYTFHEMPRYFAMRGPGTPNGGPEPLDEFFVREIDEGIAGTGIKAGILKCTTHIEGVTPHIDRILRATARAHRRTGVPISTHTDAATYRGREQQRIFSELGVDLSRVIIGHSGDSTDLGYLTELMGNGSYIGMDRIGSDNILPTGKRIDVIVELINRGYANRMVLSHDASCYNDGYNPEMKQQQWPNRHHRYISQAFLPMLRERGVPEPAITQMMVENPKEIFSRRDPY
jgi:phosphotriesterase-related protein